MEVEGRRREDRTIFPRRTKASLLRRLKNYQLLEEAMRQALDSGERERPNEQN